MIQTIIHLKFGLCLCRCQACWLVTMFVDIDDDGAFPSEAEVSGAGTESDSETEPDVVSHEDEHEEIADDDLQDV